MSAVALFELAAARPDEVVLDDGRRRRGRAELLDGVTRWGRWWGDAFGVGPGDGVAVVLPNRVEMVEVVLAATFSGLRVTPVNTALTPEEMSFVLRDCGARVVVCDGTTAALVGAALGGEPGHVSVVEVDTGEVAAALAAASDEPFPLDGPSGSTMAYTSGTTGRPKGVVRARAPRLGDQLAAIAGTGAGIHLDGGGTHLVTGPLHHAAPLGFAVMDLLLGAPLRLGGRFDAQRTLDDLRDHEVRATHLVPTMCVRLLRLPEAVRAQVRLPALHTVLHGAAPISPSVKRRMIAWWGPVLVEYWGASESGVITVATSQEWLDHPGTVGRALPTFEVWAVGAGGERVPAGEPGVLVARRRDGAPAFEYFGDPAKTAASRIGDAFSIGDIGSVDDEGWVHLSDRTSNMIITGGVNVYPAEVEAVLGDHPAVADVAVFGIPDDEWGEQVRAAIEPTEEWRGVATDELVASVLGHARGHLAAYKVPRTVELHERLPRADTGKLAVRLLRAPHWEGRERSI